MMVLVTGASGSGKSEYAENLAVKLAGKKNQDTGNKIPDADHASEICDGYLSAESHKLYYLATMRVYGEDGMRRVERHRKLRAGKGFYTVECPINVDEAFSEILMCVGDESGRKSSMPVALLECMSNLVANEMFPEPGDEQERGCMEEENPAEQNDVYITKKQQKETNSCAQNIIRQIRHLRDQTAHLVVVTNQIFEDGITYEPGTTEYIRNLGQINQLLAEMADSVVEVVAGIPLLVK